MGTSDFYGNLEIPIPRPRKDTAAGDPGLDVILSFFTAILNAHGGAAWDEIGDENGPGMVRNAFTHDPQRVGINREDLPAIYLWREKILPSSRIGSDYYVRPSKLTLLWVPPQAADQETRARREPFFNTVAAIIDSVIDPAARDVSWTVPGDPDPSARELGSLLWNHLIAWSLDVEGSERTRLLFPVDGAPPIIFDAVKVDFTLNERNEQQSEGRFDELDGIEGVAQLGTPDGGDVLDRVPFVLRLSIRSVSPATGPSAGGTTVLINGTGFDETSPPTVVFGITQATNVMVLDGAVLSCTTPAGAPGARDLVITNPSGEQQSLSGAFTYT